MTINHECLRRVLGMTYNDLCDHYRSQAKKVNKDRLLYKNKKYKVMQYHDKDVQYSVTKDDIIDGVWEVCSVCGCLVDKENECICSVV